MKRWFIARMITLEDGSRAPAVDRYTQDYRSWSSDTADLCVGQCAFPNIGPLQADPDIHLFPDQMLLDFRWDAVGQGIRTALLNKAAKLGFQTSAPGPNSTNRDVIHSFVHQVQPGINVEHGDVRDPWG